MKRARDNRATAESAADDLAGDSFIVKPSRSVQGGGGCASLGVMTWDGSSRVESAL